MTSGVNVGEAADDLRAQRHDDVKGYRAQKELLRIHGGELWIDDICDGLTVIRVAVGRRAGANGARARRRVDADGASG